MQVARDIASDEATAAPTRADDATLALAAAAGDATAFSALIERHYDRFHRLAWRWCGNSGDAEDIAQDVCVKIAHAIRGWRGEAAFTTWATRIVYTTSMDRLRSRQRLRLVEPSSMAAFVETSGDMRREVDAEQRLLDGELWDEVRRLPGQQRDAILLVYAEDMSHAEAASVMGCTEKTVSWHLHEARKRLKSRLGAVG